MSFSPRGFGLIQALLAIALTSGAIFVFATLMKVIQLNKAGSLSTAAYKIAGEEMESVRALPLLELSARTNAPFINIIYNNGASYAAGHITAPSSPKTLALSSSTSTLNLALLPYDGIADFTFESYVMASTTPIKAGLLFRGKDINNYYFFYLSSDRAALLKKVNGTETILYEIFQSFAADTWYKLKVAAGGSAISIYLNDLKIQDVADTAFSFGSLALANLNTPANFDNVVLTFNSQTFAWNFDNLAIGAAPDEWQRFGLNHLPNGAGLLTISEPFGVTTIKKIDVNVSWVERGQNKSITLSTLKTQ